MGLAAEVLILWGKSLKERFVQVFLLVVIIRRINPTAFAPSLHRLDADAKLLGDLLLGDNTLCAQPLITRGELEALSKYTTALVSKSPRVGWAIPAALSLVATSPAVAAR